MTMLLKVAHHFWQNNENATWSPSEFPVPEIEAEIKKQYERLQTERPSWKTFGTVCVFFDYRPGKDIYGRTIVPISFAFLRNCRNPSRSAAAVLPVLAKAPRTATEIHVDLPWEKTLLSARWGRAVLIPGLLLLLVAGVLFTMFMSNSDVPPSPPTQNMPSHENAADDGKMQASPPRPAQAESAARQPVELRQPPSLCSREDLMESLYLCPSIYARHQCQSGSQRIHFETWLDKTDDSRCDLWKRSSLKQYVKKDQPLSQKDRQLIDTFFLQQERQK